jgi:cytochrome c-type biogenesis protein CcmF
MFTVFMVGMLTISFGYVIYRLPLLRARNELDSWVSREAAFLANNWILLFCAFFVLFATMFPTLSEALTGERLTVGPPFFNKWMTPIGLVLLFLTGVGPLLAWRKSTLSNLRYQFTGPVALTVVALIAVFAADIPFWPSGLCFALCGFVVGTIGQEFWRGARVRQGATGTDVLTALIGLVGRSRHRYGGYIVHLGIVLMFFGFAGEGFKLDEQVVLKPGQQTTVGRFTLRHDSVQVTNDGQKQMITGHITLLKDGEPAGQMHPARWYFRNHEDQPTTEVAIRRSISEDLYVVLPQFDIQSQTATLQIVVNPLVNWIWFGFAVLALGTGIALLPESTFAFAAAKVPAGAATTSLLVLSLVVGAAGVVRAQHVEGASVVQAVPRTALERELQGEIICMCGTCGRKRVGECTCSLAGEMREEIARLVGEGKTREQVYQYYIDKYGSQEPLASPLDRGFNRLAWLFPYIMGAAGAVAIGAIAIRWSRHEQQAAPADPVPADPELEARLDDELRNLD